MFRLIPNRQGEKRANGPAHRYRPASERGPRPARKCTRRSVRRHGAMHRGCALRRVDQPHRQVLLGDLLGDRLCCDDEHVLSHPRRFGGKHRHPHGRENVDVVALARHKASTGDLDRRERTAAREHGTAVGPTIGLFGRAFGARGRVRIRKDDRPLVDPAIAWITSWVNNFGTVLTPMIPVGRSASTAATKVDTGARSCAKGL